MEINNWQHLLDLLYMQAKMRNTAHLLVEKMKMPVSNGGCGSRNLGRATEENYKNEKSRNNKLAERLIGEQAIMLACNGLQLIDGSMENSEN